MRVGSAAAPLRSPPRPAAVAPFASPYGLVVVSVGLARTLIKGSRLTVISKESVRHGNVNASYSCGSVRPIADIDVAGLARSVTTCALVPSPLP